MGEVVDIKEGNTFSGMPLFNDSADKPMSQAYNRCMVILTLKDDDLDYMGYFHKLNGEDQRRVLVLMNKFKGNGLDNVKRALLRLEML